MFLTDTCFWTHAKTLSDSKVYDLRDLQPKIEFGITHQLKKEFKTYLSGYIEIESFSIKSISENELITMNKINPLLQYLDNADQTLFSVGKIYGEIILTDDRDLLNHCISYRIKCFTLSDFVLILVRNEFISKKKAHQIWTCLFEHNILAKQKYKQLWKQLEEIA